LGGLTPLIDTVSPCLNLMPFEPVIVSEALYEKVIMRYMDLSPAFRLR
jgi:hypothetical protein